MNMPIVLLGGVGIHSRLSASLVDKLSTNYHVIGLARSSATLQAVADQLENAQSAEFIEIDLLDAQKVERLITQIEATQGAIAVYIHLAGAITLKSFLEISQTEFLSCMNANVLSAVAISRAVLRQMVTRHHGTLIFTGATASLRGGAKSSAFAAGKFALRGLAQSLAREFGPQGVHVAHLVIDGMISGERALNQFNMSADRCIAPEAVAALYADLINQPASMWTQELDIRPWNEKF